METIKFRCHITGGRYNLDNEMYLSEASIENYKNMGCKVEIYEDKQKDEE